MSRQTEAIVLEPAATANAAVIWLHGLGADGHDFEPIVPELRLPRDHGIRFIFPHAPVRPITINGGMMMRGWYDVVGADLTQREDESGIRDSAGILNDYIVREIGAGIDPGRIVVAGFSQGGAIALFAALRNAEPLAGIMGLSTYLPLPGTLAREGSSANARVPIFMAHGAFDPIIPVQHGQRSAVVLSERGHQVQWKTYSMPHSMCAEEINDIAVWLRQRLQLNSAM